MNLKKEYKETFDKIKINETDKDEVLQTILHSKNRKKGIYFILLIFLLVISSLSIVYANDIKRILNDLKVIKSDDKRATKITTDAITELNYEANLDEVHLEEENALKKEYTFSELEQLLNITFLKSNLYKKDTLKQIVTTKKDEKIAYALFEMDNFTKETAQEGQQFSLKISLSTKYNEKDTEQRYFITGAYQEETYFIRNLNTTAYIFKDYEDHDTLRNWQVLFDYDNIRYTYDLFFFHQPLEEVETKVENLLESLSY